jgi:hypothetical protein
VRDPPSKHQQCVLLPLGQAVALLQVGVGLVTNAVLLAVILGIKMLIDSRRAR